MKRYIKPSETVIALTAESAMMQTISLGKEGGSGELNNSNATGDAMTRRKGIWSED